MRSFRRSGPHVLALAALAFTFAREPASAGDAAPAADPARALAAKLQTLRMGPGVASGEVILFPLFAVADASPLPLGAGVRGAPLAFAESTPKLGRKTVSVTNAGSTATLLLAGTVVEGGRRDRIVRFDRVIPASTTVDVEVMPASMARDTRPADAPFRIADFVAPSYLRESAQFNPDPNAVPRFVSHFLEFRNPSDTRTSLVAVGDSDALSDFCLTCQNAFSSWPTVTPTGSPVGGILVVRGRVQAIEVFASNGLLQAYSGPLLKSLAFPAAAIALRAKRLGIAVPGPEDPVGTVAVATTLSENLLASLATATYSRRKTTDPAFVGDAWIIRLKDGGRGTALVRDGLLLHAAVYPGDPFEDALYSKPLDPLAPEDVSGGSGDDIGIGEIERFVSRGGRLTGAEERLLERMRERRTPR